MNACTCNGFYRSGHIVMLPDHHIKVDSGDPDYLKALAQEDIKQVSTINAPRVDRTVHIQDKATLNKWASNYMHELGHWVHALTGEKKPKHIATTKVTISERGVRKNSGEWFADHFRTWFIDPEGLRKWNPDVANFIEETVEAATRSLQKQQRHKRQRSW